jgi:hypothetical protein
MRVGSELRRHEAAAKQARKGVGSRPNGGDWLRYRPSSTDVCLALGTFALVIGSAMAVRRSASGRGPAGPIRPHPG